MSSSALISILSKGEDHESLLDLISSVSLSLNSLPEETFPELLSASSEWICKNSSSKKLEPLLSLCISIHQHQGYTEVFSYPLNDETAIPPNSSLLSCILSLLNSILKSPQAEKYIRLLSKLLILSCFIVEQKTVPDSFRRKGTLKFILTLFKNLIKAEAKSDQSLRVLKLIADFCSKITYNSNKCREYLIRKGAVQVFCNILSPTSAYQKDSEFLYKILYALGNLAGSTDQQLLVWVTGGTTLALNFFNNPEMLEPASFTLWKSSIDAFEVQESIMAEDYDQKALRTLSMSPSPQVTTFLIGSLRRLSANPSYKENLAAPVSACFLEWLGKLTKQVYILPLKELVAGLGSLCTNLEIAQEVVKAAGIEIVLEVILRHLDQAKLVKTCVGSLVNLSVQGDFYLEGIVDRITSNIKFYEVVNLLLEKYSNSTYMMEYVLKLILNGLQNSNCLFHLSEKPFLMKMAKIFQYSKNEEDIFLLCVCILRVLVSHKKGLDIFKESFDSSVVLWTLEGFEKSINNLKALTESILLISAITQEEGEFLDYLKNCEKLSICIKLSLEHYANDKSSTAVLTECLANLPVEEINMLL